MIGVLRGSNVVMGPGLRARHRKLPNVSAFISSLPAYGRSLAYNTLHVWRNRKAPKAPAIDRAGFDIVTVVFEPEVDLLALQARSFDRFLDPAFDGLIFVVVNDLCCRKVVAQIERNVIRQYGRWSDRVRLVPFHEIAYRLDPANGWILQQALKLACSNIVSRRHYVVFDAKNHLVAPATKNHFVDADGFALQTLERDATHLPRHQETCARYFGNDPDDHARPKFVPMTPFVLHTQSVRELVTNIEERERASLADFFCETRLLSEFLLYGSYLDARCGGAESLYRSVPCKTVTLWPGDETISGIADAQHQAIFCFGAHREHLAGIDACRRGALDAFWRRIGLLQEGETLAGLAAASDQRPSPAGERLSRWATWPMLAGGVIILASITLFRAAPFAPEVGFGGAAVGLLAAATKLRGRLGSLMLLGATLAVAAAVGAGLVAALKQDIRVAGEADLIAHGGPLGWTLRPGAHRVVKTINGRTIYDVVYDIDPSGQRTTKSAPVGAAVAFLGDSFTFGEGVPDADTLPQAVSDLTGRRLHVINLGVSAYSPAQVLRELQLGLYDAILKPAKVFFMLTASWHVDRVACLDDWVVGAPRYTLRDLGLVADGQCQVPPEPKGIRGVVKRTALYQALFAGKLPFVSDDDIATYIAVVVEAAKVAEAKYGVPLKILYLRNAGYLRFSGYSDDDIILRMRAGGADVLEMTLPHEGKAGFAIPGDGHPNGVGNRLRAKMLVDALRANDAGLLNP